MDPYSAIIPVLTSLLFLAVASLATILYMALQCETSYSYEGKYL